MKINTWAINERGGTAEPLVYDRTLGSRDVLVKITHRSLARGDIQFIDNVWGDTRFPLVPSHEIVGIVEEAGSEAPDLQPSDRVGIGYQQEACFECSFCTQGIENSAPGRRSSPSTAAAAWPNTSSSIVGSLSRCRRSLIRPPQVRCSHWLGPNAETPRRDFLSAIPSIGADHPAPMRA